MWHQQRRGWIRPRLNESPSQKEGKSREVEPVTARAVQRLNESPSEKEGKSTASLLLQAYLAASMKVPPKRKGNQQKNTYAGTSRQPQ